MKIQYAKLASCNKKTSSQKLGGLADPADCYDIPLNSK